jgi:hypothetical protein
MRRVVVILAILLLLSATVLPRSASAGGWHHAHHGGVWWLPGAIIGGLVLGAVTLATAPLWALTPPPAPPQPVVVPAPAQVVRLQAQPYTAPLLPVPPPDSAPPARAYQPATYASAAAPAVKREVVYEHGRYVLYGDGVREPWQWVWIPAAAPPPPPPPPPAR